MSRGVRALLVAAAIALLAGGCRGEQQERQAAATVAPILATPTAKIAATPTRSTPATPAAVNTEGAAPTPTPIHVEATATASHPRPIVVTVVARDLRFEPAVLTIPPHTVITLVMENEDEGVLHDIGVTVVGGGRTETCAGPCTSRFDFGAHVAGKFQFFCSIHPGMAGDLNVQQ